MKMHLDCIPCFFKQVVKVGRLISDDEEVQREFLDDMARLMIQSSSDMTAVELSREMYAYVYRKFGDVDPYKVIRHQSNEMALKLYPKLKKKIEYSEDPLLTAVELAVAGNIIDYGAKHDLDINAEIESLLMNHTMRFEKSLSAYEGFRQELKEAESILYIADNAGEIVFDKLLLEELVLEKKIVFAVRGKPVINDAVLEDAIQCGIDQIVEVISSGSDAPGTILQYCTKDFLGRFANSDLVISKGQGNFESLYGCQRPIYFLFKAKCPLIADKVGAQVGDGILTKNICDEELSSNLRIGQVV